jgi:exodeoxyribonuclease VII large subunit
LIASVESAAYSDFVKVLGERWGGLEISLMDVQVQGEVATEQIVQAIESFNQQANPPEVLVITRGGGAAEDLQAFSTEQVTRAVAASRIPTLVAIGHERDISLAELAADQRASTPSNAAELLVPDKSYVLRQLQTTSEQLEQAAEQKLADARSLLAQNKSNLLVNIERAFTYRNERLIAQARLLMALDPELALARGFTLVRKQGRVLRKVSSLAEGDIVEITFSDGAATAGIQSVAQRTRSI